jgi:hypothetical protein
MATRSFFLYWFVNTSESRVTPEKGKEEPIGQGVNACSYFVFSLLPLFYIRPISHSLFLLNDFFTGKLGFESLPRRFFSSAI